MTITEKIAVVLGGQPLNRNIVEKFRAMGMKVVVVDYRSDINIPFDRHLKFDAINPNLGSRLHELGIENVECVYTSMDDAGLAQRSVCREYGLCCASKDSIACAHNKKIMHERWRAAGILNRDSRCFSRFDQDRLVAMNAVCRLIFKPVDACASRGITVVDECAPLDRMKLAFDFARGNSSSGLVNVEEFVSGTEYTVEMLGDSKGHVAAYSVSKKYHTDNAGSNKVAVKLHYNAKDVPDDVYTKIAEFGILCYRTLGLSSSLGHFEVILKDGTGVPTPIELGARSSGFIASDLVDIASGRCFLDDFRNVQHGATIEDGVLPRGKASSMYFFYDLPTGSTARRKGSILPYLRPFARSLAGDRSRLVRGARFNRLNADTDRYGYEILYGERSSFSIDSVKSAEAAFIQDFTQDPEGEIDISIPIFDSITHPTMDGNWLNARYNSLADMPELVADMHSFNISHAFAVGMKGVGGYSLNDFARFCATNTKLTSIAFWEPIWTNEELAELLKLGYSGIKIHPRLLGPEYDEERVVDAIKEANRLGLVVLYCSFNGVSRDFGRKTEGLSFVLIHSGYLDFENTYDIMSEGHPDVLLDLSYTLFHNAQQRSRILDLVGSCPDRFCIGSDHPEINHLQLRRFLTRECAVLTDTMRHAIYHRNLEKFVENVKKKGLSI